MVYDVTVIIPTTAEKSREEGIKRAIESIRRSSAQSVNILCYVNGKKFDENVCHFLQNQPDVEYFYDEVGSFPNALYQARKRVKTDYFAYLDDDDELLGLSVDERMEEFEAHPELDLVVGKGIRKINNEEKEVQKNITECRTDPLRALLRKHGNWLASCSGLYKTESFPASFFKDYVSYAEWTYFAYKAALSKKIGFIDKSVFVVNFSENSLSSSLNYMRGQHTCVRQVLQLELPADVRKILKHKLDDAAHYVAHQALQQRQFSLAMKFHLLSMFSFTGLKKYWLFTRYFLGVGDKK